MNACEKKALSALKAYLEFEEQGERRMIYAVATGEGKAYSFFFDTPVSGSIVWHLNDDFSVRVTELCARTEQGELPLTVERSDDGYELIARVTLPAPTRLTVTCCCEALDASESAALMREQYGNRVAHVELLLASERTLVEEKALLQEEKAALQEEKVALEHTLHCTEG